MKILPLEEKFIALLTKVVWWFDFKWNKGTLFVFFFFSFIVPTLCGFLLQVHYFLTTPNKSILDYGLNLFIFPILHGITIAIPSLAAILFHWIDARINVLQQLNKNPNPNHYNGWLWKARLMVFCCLLVFIDMLIIEDSQGLFLIKTGAVAFFSSITLICCYVLCVNQMPPLEKNKYKKREELKNKNLSLNPPTQ